ncbi:MAG: LysR family transcriptional regulator [Phenylobacterium sp.]|uniref:LysR family transcriptional regulator n=1 Tax=Phenylobacterium sp. TaxID=1871053 RepID=UPI00391B63B1
MDRLDEMAMFVAVADGRSFAQAARRLGVSPAQASKLVARLEDRLKTRLLNRTTRDVSLTDAGRAYLQNARALVEQFEALEASVQENAGPRGLLKLSAPIAFGAVELEGALLDFARAFPEVSLEVSFTDRMTNLVDEGFDAAVRITRLPDSSLVARRLSETQIVTVASPDYLARFAAPRTPAELAERETILDLNLAEPRVWTFGRGSGRQDVRVTGRLRFAGAGPCLAAARRGFGVARVPAFVAAEDLRLGRVQAILRGDEPDPLPIQVVYPHARHLPAKVRALVDFLVGRYAGEPPWGRGWS